MNELIKKVSDLFRESCARIIGLSEDETPWNLSPEEMEFRRTLITKGVEELRNDKLWSPLPRRSIEDILNEDISSLSLELRPAEPLKKIMKNRVT